VPDDFYCDEALSGRTPVDVVAETDAVLACRHTRPFWPLHIVAADVVRAHLHFHVNAGDPLR
jgi:histidine triad (HIT) family protein